MSKVATGTERKASIKELWSRFTAAEARVIRAAVRWVNRNDDGRAETLHLLTRDNMELARSVTAMQKAKRAVGRAFLKKHGIK